MSEKKFRGTAQRIVELSP